jgi:hypothetical protein
MQEIYNIYKYFIIIGSTALFGPWPTSDFATNHFLGWVVNPTPTLSNPGGSIFFFCQGFLSC